MSENKTKKEITPVNLSSVDFLIATYKNRAGLERLLHSILDIYPGAKVTVADSDRHLDRAYYKELRKELGEAGLLNRLKIHHIAYKSPIGHAFNELIKLSGSTYKLLLTDQDIVTKETDVAKMVRVCRSNKTIGVVGGQLNDDKPKSEKEASKTEDGDTFYTVKFLNRFMLVQGDVRHYHRFNATSDDPFNEFCQKAPTRLPYKLVATNVKLTSNQDYENDDESETTTPETTTSDSESGGGTTEPDLSSEAGDSGSGDDGDTRGDDTSASERTDEKGQDQSTRRRPGGGRSGSVQGQGDK
ncbi:MAG: hypothetical protein Tp172MES00d2C118482111_33 [Prokaryotic dsDNA virus sp.]|nr:MAG: hypothetical protein Tp172MES00d2C118482111_33 [Prokaryotic dsDNA virus sp.]|tara:strand:+ start:1898 stop:2797 length:900 start_codon:yes stop_codon:yes gene_type:complete